VTAATAVTVAPTVSRYCASFHGGSVRHRRNTASTGYALPCVGSSLAYRRPTNDPRDRRPAGPPLRPVRRLRPSASPGTVTPLRRLRSRDRWILQHILLQEVSSVRAAGDRDRACTRQTEESRMSEPVRNAAYAAPREGESLDDFMKRVKYLSVPNSLKRVAWAVGKPVGQLAAHWDASKRDA
jgi:hypothetical protein